MRGRGLILGDIHEHAWKDHGRSLATPYWTAFLSILLEESEQISMAGFHAMRLCLRNDPFGFRWAKAFGNSLKDSVSVHISFTFMGGVGC